MSRLFVLGLCVLFTALPARAALVNGDFEAGNTGFTTDYVFAATNATEGEYTVRSDPQNWNGGFAAMGDHTTGTGLMMVINGATSGNLVVWGQDVAVTPFATYDFSSWVATAVAGGPAALIVQVNGVTLGSSFTAPDLPGAWSNFAREWTAGDVTTAQLRIINTNQSVFPNDFHLDDLSFTASAIPEPATAGMLALSAALLLRRRRRVCFRRSSTGSAASIHDVE